MSNEKLGAEQGRTDGALVYIGGLSADTQFALHEYSSKHDYDEWLGDRTWIEVHWWAWLVALLKVEPDTDDLFPKGKWATIQRLEELLNVSLAEYQRARRASKEPK